MKNLLLVVQDELTLDVLEAMVNMRFKNVRVLTASSSYAALDVLASLWVDFIVADPQLPVGEGRALADYWQQHYPHIPLLALVHDHSPGIESRLREWGIQHWFSRPFDINELACRIAKEIQLEPWAAAARADRVRPARERAKPRHRLRRLISASLNWYLPRGKVAD